MDTTKNYIAWIDDLSKNYPSIRLEFFATSTEEALQKTKTWLKENAIHLRDYTMKIVDDLTRQLLLKVEIHEPSDEVKIPAERFFQQSEKNSRTFYVYIYLDDGKLFYDLNYKADCPNQALEKAKTYMANACPEHEIYRAIVKEKGYPSDVLLDRVVENEPGFTDDDLAELLGIRDEEAETPVTLDEVENSDTKKIYRTEVYLTEKDRAKLNWIDSYLGLSKLRESEEAEVRKESLDSHFKEEIPGEAETLKDISNATDLYHAANDLIQISKQLTKVANQLLTTK